MQRYFLSDAYAKNLTKKYPFGFRAFYQKLIIKIPIKNIGFYAEIKPGSLAGGSR